jgi:8-hydroxy-5-deazaflavin:NADPH oxidoreductase
MKIGIVGSGRMGRAIAGHLSRAGHVVRLSNSRGPGSLDEIAGDAGATPATIADAVASSEVVFLAIPYKAVDQVAASGAPWDGKLVVDLTNYYEGRDGAELDPGDESSSVLVARRLLGARVVKAFNTILWSRLEEESRPAGPERLAIFLAGDDAGANAVVAGLIDDAGFAAVETGSLAAGGRRQQPGSAIYNVPLTAAEAEALLAGRTGS